ncbi:MAG: nuclear transport factor 2 family protein [Coleofasciculus sp. S288]|nr:nuclear transport factor 2 family protein [Coleofasciculus sp. S288]
MACGLTLLTITSALSLSLIPVQLQASAKSETAPAVKSAQASSRRIEAARQFLQAVEAKDINTINRLIADGVVLEQPYFSRGESNRVAGRQAANAFFNRIFNQYSQIRFVDVVFRQSQFDNTVILEGSGDFRIADTQRPYRNQYVVVLEIIDGRVTLIREYFNPLIAAEAFEVEPNQLLPNQQN